MPKRVEKCGRNAVDVVRQVVGLKDLDEVGRAVGGKPRNTRLGSYESSSLPSSEVHCDGSFLHGPQLPLMHALFAAEEGQLQPWLSKQNP